MNKTSWITAILAFILTSPASFPQTRTGSGQATITAKVKLVNVSFRLTTKKGDMVRGEFKPEDFEVYENRVRQEITHFSPTEGPITTVLLLDYSRQAVGFSARSENEVWAAPLTLVENLRPEDWCAVVIYDMRAYVEENDKTNGIFQDFTQNRNAVTKTLMTVFKSDPAFSESNLSDAVKTILDLLKENDSLKEKTSIILVSTGLDTFSKNRYDSVLKEVQNSGVMIFTVGIGQNFRIRYDNYLNGSDRMELLMADNRLRSLAELSGGQVFLPRFVGELPSIFREISQQLRDQYSLGYVSTNTKLDGKFRKIEIKVKKKAVNEKGKEEEIIAHHRQGYHGLTE